MNIFTKLDQIDLTATEQSLISYIKENYQKFIKMELKEICENCFVSKSTIYRLCYKLNLSGLSEFKALIIADIDDYLKEKLDIDYNYPIKKDKIAYGIINTMHELYQQTLISSVNLIDTTQIKKIVRLLKDSKYIDFYTSAGNIYFAENFKFQMQEIGRFINVPIEDYHMRLTAATSDETHIAIITSYEGRGYSTNDLVNTLKRNKTSIILISSTHDNPLIKYADHIIYLNSYENHYNKLSSFSTRLSLLFNLDCLYTYYFNLDYDKNINYKLTAYNKLSKKHK